MALPPSTANWHWKNKNVTRWGTEWFERELTTLSVTGDKEGEVVSISTVSEVEGDIELGQRKSKLITIFDCNIRMKWVGTNSDGTEVNGTVTIPEVSHEIVCDKLSEFVYNWTLSTDPSPEAISIFALAKARLPAALETKLATFPLAIIDAHGKDLTVSADPSRSGTPAPPSASVPSPLAAQTAAASQPAKKAEGKAHNTTTVKVDATFQAAADDLFDLLTNEKKIPMWTRAPAQSSGEVGSEYSLFGGGVKGKFISLDRPTQIVQTWALQSPTWPTGHDGILTTTLEQSTDSTKVTFSLAGVPLGTEDEIKRNIEGYYVHGFRSIGYVILTEATSVYSSSRDQKKSASRPRKSQTQDGNYVLAILIGALVFIAAFSIPYLSSIPLFEAK